MKRFINRVEKYRQLVFDAERYIWQNPETGYKEIKTTAFLGAEFEKLGYKLNYAEGITGFYTVLDTKKEGPEVLILAELDSIICPEHPDSDKQTGAVHACGHNAQCAALLGIAAALKEQGALDELCGRIRLCAVPAEELLEIEYRSKLKAEGKIKYFGGKTEFLSRGYFDGVDIAFMIHTSSQTGAHAGSIGCVAKRIIYKGVAAHAGGSPWLGKNALYAATCGLNAVNALRETFKESDIIRVHPIITSGGAMVNAIPETVTLESYIRGKTFEGICEANKKVNRALCGAALSLGTNVDIIDFPGYAPLVNDINLIDIFLSAAREIAPDQEIKDERNITGSGSTDMGDLSCIMPVIHPHCAGAIGKGHGNDYQIADPEKACILSAKLQLGLLYALLSDNAKQAKKVLKEFKPMFASKEEYLTYMDNLNASGDRIEYLQNEAKIKL